MAERKWLQREESFEKESRNRFSEASKCPKYIWALREFSFGWTSWSFTLNLNSNIKGVNEAFGVRLTIPETKSSKPAAILYLSLTPEGSWSEWTWLLLWSCTEVPKSKVISKFSIGVPKSSRLFLALLLVFVMNHKVLIQFFACLSWFWGWTFQMHHFLPSSEWSRSPVQSVCRSLTFSPQNAHGLLARRIYFLQRFFTGRKSVAGWRTRAAWCVGGGGWVLV